MKTNTCLFVTLNLVLMLILSGCGLVNQSKVEVPIPGDGVQTFTGKVADEYMAMKVANEKTAKGRMNDVVGGITRLVPYLYLVLIAGGIFAFFTRSKYAAIIPITAAIAIALAFFLAAWIECIMYGLLAITILIIIWRARSYQVERNEAEGKS